MRTILIIEDDPEIRGSLKDLLTFEKFNVFEAANGALGAELAYKHLPDIILCDVLMPVMDGFEVLSELRKETNTALIPFVFLTALADKSNIRTGMNMGADDYITKPFSIDELLNTIRTRLERAERLKNYTKQNMEKLRHNIISFLPHELITPLNGIISFGEIFRDFSETLSPKEIAEIGAYITESGTRFYDLVQKYLLYIQITVNKSTGYPSIQSPGFIRDIENTTRNIAKKYNRSNDLSLQLTEVNQPVPGKEMEIIIKELVDNAFKFSHIRTPVSVSSRIADNFYEITISDKGRGMPADSLHHVGAFMQFDRNKYEQQGIGMGLFLSTEITKILGGSVNISSTPGSGTAVVVKIPLNS